MFLDIEIFYFFNHLPHNNILNTAALWVHYATRYGLIYYPFLIFLLLAKSKQKALLGKLLTLSAAGTYLLTDVIIKNLVQRPRPYQALSKVLFLPPVPNSYSFPSGQVAVAFALASIVWFRFPRTVYGYGGYMLAALIAVDRMYMGHHYFFDVLVGGLIGTLVAYITNYYFTHHKKTSFKNMSRLPLSFRKP